MTYWDTRHVDLDVSGADLSRSVQTISLYAMGICTDALQVLEGKVYFELDVEDLGGASGYFTFLGIATSDHALTGYPGISGGEYSCGYQITGNIWSGGSFQSSGASYTYGDTVCIAFDKSTGKVWFGKNGVWNGSGDPASGANPSVTESVFITNDMYAAAGMRNDPTGITAKLTLGENDYTIPVGFSMPLGTISSNDFVGVITAIDGAFSGGTFLNGDLVGEISAVEGTFQSGDFVNALDGNINNILGEFQYGPIHLAHFPLDYINNGITPDLIHNAVGTVDNMAEDPSGVLLGGFSGNSLAGDSCGISFTPSITEVKALGAVSFWFKSPSTETGNCFLFYGGYYLYFSATGFGYLSYNTGSSYGGSLYTYVLEKDKWIHFVAVNTGEFETSFYIDNVLIGTMNVVPWEVEGFGFYESFSSAHVPSFDDIRIYSDTLSVDDINNLYTMTSPDYVNNRMSGELEDITGIFSGTVENVALSSDLNGSIERVIGSFEIYQEIIGIFSGDIEKLSGLFVSGNNLSGVINNIISEMSSIVGYTGYLSGTIKENVLGTFSTGSKLDAKINKLDGNFYGSLKIHGGLSGSIIPTAGEFLGGYGNILSGDIIPITSNFDAYLTAIPITCNFNEDISRITSSFYVIDGSVCNFVGTIKRLRGSFKAKETTEIYSYLNGEIIPLNGYILCLADYDHGIMGNVRGAVR